MDDNTSPGFEPPINPTPARPSASDTRTGEREAPREARPLRKATIEDSSDEDDLSESDDDMPMQVVDSDDEDKRSQDDEALSAAEWINVDFERQLAAAGASFLLAVEA